MGVVPEEFQGNVGRFWIGDKNSWGYIGGEDSCRLDGSPITAIFRHGWQVLCGSQVVSVLLALLGVYFTYCAVKRTASNTPRVT